MIRKSYLILMTCEICRKDLGNSKDSLSSDESLKKSLHSYLSVTPGFSVFDEWGSSSFGDLLAKIWECSKRSLTKS